MLKRIFLIGLRGSGKSTVGKALAKRFGCPFTDLDEYLSSREGKSISEIVDQAGWGEFRRLERECLLEASEKMDCGGVIATGGGVVLDGGNRKYMQENGLVFWLAAAPETLCQRLSDNPLAEQRPALSNKELLEEMQDLARERARHYASSAHCIIDGEGEAEDICDLICQLSQC